MDSLYNSTLHGRYYPPESLVRVPNRYARLLDIARDSLGFRPGRVLEIGAESAAIAEFVISRLGLTEDGYICADISNHVIDSLQRRGIPAVKMDVSADRLPLADGSIDLVIMSEVIEHLLNPDHAISEIARVLGKSRVLMVSTPNLASWVNRVLLPLGIQPAFTETSTVRHFGRGPIALSTRPVGHLRLYTKHALTEFLSSSGFRVELVEGYPAIAEVMPGVPGSRVDKVLSRLSGVASGLIVCARREPPGVP